MKKANVLLILSAAGVLFSGYLSLTKLLSDSCAFGETCPYFLGLPACYYGFVMYGALLAASVLLVMKKYTRKTLMRTIQGISGFGILFALFFTVPEMMNFKNYSLGLPTCAYGLIMYIIVFGVSTFWEHG